MNPKSLSQLLKNIIDVDNKWDRLIVGMSLDSRDVKTGDLFFACQGTEQDGREYIDAAIEKGAVAVISEKNSKGEDFVFRTHKDKHIPIYSLDAVNKKISEIAARFYELPSQKMTVIGITGTNGKTSCCHFLAQALQMNGEIVGLLGTLGNGLYGDIKAGSHTTPDPIEMQKLLYEMHQQGATFVIMEASSHGIDQGRQAAIDFNMAIFTNLSRDHLDYHGDMVAYGQAKRKLFQQPGLKSAIFNVDDDFGRQLIEEFHPLLKVYGFSAEGRLCDQNIPLVRAHQVNLNLEGLTASLYTPWGDGLLHTSLLGRFNLSNLLAVLTALGILGYSLERSLGLLSKVKGVAGRAELFTGKNKPYVVVDYAHTPDALKKVLASLREYVKGELWCVFGCGGNRDQGKRAQMGLIAETNADHVVVTDDNPRFEEPSSIVADILQGMERPEFAVVEHDRRRAITHAIHCAEVGDIVLVAGKGHESYQQVGNEKHPFNDELEVQMILAET